LGRGDGPLSGSGCASGGRPPRGGGSKFPIGSTSVLFSAT
jgi:hypothetical protein